MGKVLAERYRHSQLHIAIGPFSIHCVDTFFILLYIHISIQIMHIYMYTYYKRVVWEYIFIFESRRLIANTGGLRIIYMLLL